MNHDCPPKNTKTACTLDHTAKRAFDAFAKGTPARKEWRKWIPFLHPVEILIEIAKAKADKKSVHQKAKV
jgi:hypothetical protein